MNFYVNSQGQIIRIDPEDIFQGSVNANTINFIGAFPSTCPVTVAFRLPTGVWTTPASMGMNSDSPLPGVQQPDGTQFNIWRYTIPGTVTEHYGTVNLQFYIYAQGSDGTGNMIATASSSFEVKKGVPVVLPDPSDDYETLLTNILSALQQLQQADSEGALAAQQSATAAANSASAAANSATAASNSATIAQTNAQSAQTNAQTAVSAANRAEDSETAAQAAQSAAESAQAAAEAARDEAEELVEGKIENLSVETLNIGDVELTGTSDGILWSDIAVGEEMNGETLHFNTSTDITYEDFPSDSDEILITFENGYKLAVRSQAQGAEIAMLDAGGSVAGPVIYIADGGWTDGLYDFSNAEVDSLIVQSMETEETAVSEAAKKFISAVIKTDITLNVDGNIRVGNNGIYSSKNPTNANELTRKAYVDSQDTNLRNNKYDKTGGTISGDVVVTGDLTVQGTTTTNDTETLQVKDNLIVTNSDGATLAGLSGLIIRTSPTQSYGIVYDPANEGTVKLGLGTYNAETGVFTFATGEGLPVSVRALSTAWSNLHLAAWDAAGNQFVDAGKAVADFQEKLTFDSTPTQNSTNPVTSGGVKSYVDNVASNIEEQIPPAITVDSALSSTSENPVQNKVVNEAIDVVSETATNAFNIADNIISGDQTAYKAYRDGSGNNIEDTYAKKTEIPAEYTLPVADSDTLGGVKPVAKTSEMTQDVGVDSNGVLYTKPAPPVDSTPTSGSDNPVSSGGVYTALKNYVALTGEQTIVGEKTFQEQINSPGFSASTQGEEGYPKTYYTNTMVINYLSATLVYTYSFPNQDGIIALETDVTDAVTPLQQDIEQAQTDIGNLQDDVTALQNAVNASYYTTQDITAAYTTRTTAAGAQIVDRGLAMLKTVQGKTVSSENLIPYPYASNTFTEGGLTYTNNGDGSITINGTATVPHNFKLTEDDSLYLPAGTYTAKLYGGSDDIYLVTGRSTNPNITTYYGDRTFSLPEYNQIGHCLIQTRAGATFNNVTVRPMLNAGNSALPYANYFSGLKNAYFQSLKSTGADSETDEISLAAAAEIPEYNSIDLENGQNITGGRTLVFNGTEAWTQANGGFSYTLPETGVASTSIVGLPYLAGTGELSSLQDGYANNDATTLLVKDSTCATVADFQQKLASLSSAGTPLEVRYQLASPTSTSLDVSPYYRAFNGGTETVEPGSTDNSDYGAVSTLTQNYVEKGGIDL